MLWKKDQGIRQGQYSDALIKYGKGSDKLMAVHDSLARIDKSIFLTMKKYLELYGYPENISSYHELAINAFPIIIGHNHNYDDQLALLPFLYEGYKKGHCSLGDLVWLLGEMHESKYQGKRYEMKSNRFTTEQEFIELNEALELGLSL